MSGFDQKSRRHTELVSRIANCVLLVGCLMLTESSSSAQWLGKKGSRPSGPAMQAAPEQGFAGYIRRLTKEARAAADRGEMDTARTLAERAHKISLTCKAMMATDSDCSPAATAALAREYGSTLGGTASPSAAVVAQTSPLELNSLLDAPVAEVAPAIPPTPAPALPPADLKPTVRQHTENQPTPANQRKRDAPVANAPVAKASVTKAPVTKRHTPPARSVPHFAENSRLANATPARASVGFLAMQSDWMSQNADEVIEELAERPVRQSKPTPRSRRPVALAEPEEEVLEPEVTTAIGRGGSKWKLDADDSEEDAVLESAPQLPPQDVRSRHPGNPSMPETTPVTTEPRIGVWSNGQKNSAASGRNLNVVSMSEFLNPLPANQAARDVLDRAPRVIETDFRSSTASQATPVNIASRERTDSASAPRTLGATDDSNLIVAQETAKPAVSYRESAAVDWGETTSPASPPRAARVQPLRIELAWPEWEAPPRPLAAGIVLLAFGLLLFGMSFRWT